VLPNKPSIAVMPFTNLSGDPEQEYFSDGMVVEITNALSRIRSIFVIASGSTLSFKGKPVSPQEVGRRLGVRYVLEGSVRKAGDRVRIAVQLIDATDGAQVWTHRFEEPLNDVFALQDRVALSVAGQIEPTVQQAEIRRASARPTENMGSYDLYMRAMALFHTTAKTGVLEALELVKRAVVLDPDYGRALELGAACHYLVVMFGWSEDPETHRREALAMMRRGLKAGADDAYVLAPSALVMADLEGDLEAAVALVDRALALNPGSSMAWLMSGAIRNRAGDTDLAGEHIETSMRLDPVGPDRSSQMAFLAAIRQQQRRFKESVTLARECVQQADSALGYAILSSSYGHLGQTQAALAALARYRTLSPLPIQDFARSITHQPAHIKLFLDGIALAEGKSPSEAPGDTQ
jgi:adenylate cyclase